MNINKRIPALLQFIVLTVLIIYGATAVFATPTPTPEHPNMNALQTVAAENGRVRVIVSLDVGSYAPEGLLDSPAAVNAQRVSIDSAQNRVLDALQSLDSELLARYKYTPAIALSVNAAALDTLATLPGVTAISEDVPEPPALASSIPVIGADDAWAAGYTGEGTVVAVLDTGVDKNHPFFATNGQKIVSEACYSSNYTPYGASSLCPSSVPESTAVDSGLNCNTSIFGCDHGTHVAGIVAGNDTAGPDIGVAPDANIIAIQVFSRFDSTDYCGQNSPCALTFISDQIKGLERVYELQNDFNIVAVNMSLGGGYFTNYCDAHENARERKVAIDNLKAVNIGTVIAAGNDYYRQALGMPACISSAISVGSTTDADDVSSFSNVADFLSLLAPGSTIESSVPGTGTAAFNGTSMAAPHVAGAWAVMREAMPSATVDQLLTVFRDTGTSVDDQRSSGVITDMRRINLDGALSTLGVVLDLEKTVNTAVAWPGDTLTYTLTARNASLVTANDVILTDTLPAYHTLITDTVSGNAFYDSTTAGGTITWTLGTLNPGQTVTHTFGASLDATPGSYGAITNTAVLTAPLAASAASDATTTTINGVAACGYTETFESGSLPAYWQTNTTNEGRVRVLAGQPSPHGGSYALYLDDAVANETTSLASAVLALNLDGAVQPQLAFWWRENFDENHPEDGVFLSDDDGQTWAQIFSFNDGPQSYTHTILDLTQAAADAGLTLGPRILVKFQFYDNAPISDTFSYDGYVIDDILIECSGVTFDPAQTMSNGRPNAGDTLHTILTVSNSGSETANDVMLTTSLPTGLSLAGQATLTDTLGSVSTYTPTLPLLADGLSLASGDRITLSLPLQVDSASAGGTILTPTITVTGSNKLLPTIAHSSLTINHVPVAAADAVTTTINTAVSLTPLANDSDGDEDMLTITAVTDPNHGSLDRQGDTFTYTPTLAFSGTDSFTYTITDGFGGEDTATVTLNVRNLVYLPFIIKP